MRQPWIPHNSAFGEEGAGRFRKPNDSCILWFFRSQFNLAYPVLQILRPRCRERSFNIETGQTADLRVEIRRCWLAWFSKALYSHLAHLHRYRQNRVAIVGIDDIRGLRLIVTYSLYVAYRFARISISNDRQARSIRVRVAALVIRLNFNGS